MAGMYRIKGRVFFFDDQSLTAIPVGTVVRASETDSEPAVLMKWIDHKGKMRSERVPAQLWTRYVSSELDPL